MMFRRLLFVAIAIVTLALSAHVRVHAARVNTFVKARASRITESNINRNSDGTINFILFGVQPQVKQCRSRSRSMSVRLRHNVRGMLVPTGATVVQITSSSALADLPLAFIVCDDCGA